MIPLWLKPAVYIVFTWFLNNTCTRSRQGDSSRLRSKLSQIFANTFFFILPFVFPAECNLRPRWFFHVVIPLFLVCDLMCKANEKKVQKTFESETKHRSNFEPSLGCFCLDFLIFFFGQSSNSAPWLVSLCVHQAKQKNVKWLCKCWDATPRGLFEARSALQEKRKIHSNHI